MDTIKFLKINFDNFYANPSSRFEESINYLNQDYQEKAVFYRANNFTNNLISLLTAENLQAFAVKLLSSLDAMLELNTSCNLSFMFLYKSSFDSLRRALEITVLGQYYELVQNNTDTIFDWMNSKTDTPKFRKMINELSTVKRFSDLNTLFNWKNELQDLYWRLCDFSHTKGHEKSIISLNKSDFFKPILNIQALEDFLTKYINTVQQIAIIYAINNPILIIGLPTLEKFGFTSQNGLFSDSQAQNLRDLLPERYKEYVVQLIEQDNAIKTRVEEINKMPDSESYTKIKDLLK